MSDPAEDLSAGVVPREDKNFIEGQLQEENDRRRWKNVFLALAALVVVAFYCLFIAETHYFRNKHIGYVQAVMLVLWATIPTLILIKILGYVAYSKSADNNDRTVPSPLLGTLQELGNACIKRLGK